MRSLVSAIISATLIVGGIAAIETPVHASQMRTCNHVYDWDAFVGTGLGPGYFESDWESGNCSPVRELQTRVECHPSAGGSEYYEKSGIVSGNEVEDMASCLFAGIADHGWTRFRTKGTTTWGNWVSNWTRCCTKTNKRTEHMG